MKIGVNIHGLIVGLLDLLGKEQKRRLEGVCNLKVEGRGTWSLELFR